MNNPQIGILTHFLIHQAGKCVFLSVYYDEIITL